jgi:hypothetical protein
VSVGRANVRRLTSLIVQLVMFYLNAAEENQGIVSGAALRVSIAIPTRPSVSAGLAPSSMTPFHANSVPIMIPPARLVQTRHLYLNSRRPAGSRGVFYRSLVVICSILHTLLCTRPLSNGCCLSLLRFCAWVPNIASDADSTMASPFVRCGHTGLERNVFYSGAIDSPFITGVFHGPKTKTIPNDMLSVNKTELTDLYCLPLVSAKTYCDASEDSIVYRYKQRD